MDINLKGGIFLKQYRNSIFKEFFRKSIHIMSAFVPFLLSKFYLPTLVLLFCALCFYCSSEILRLKGIEVPVVSKITQVAARKRDENKFVLGPVTLVLGIIICSLFYENQFVKMGVFALAFGDGLASLSGKLFGRVHIPFTNGKTACGSLTCFFAVYISMYCVCGNSYVSFILGFTAMLVEVIPMTDFDNIIIPVLIGFLSKCLLA